MDKQGIVCLYNGIILISLKKVLMHVTWINAKMWNNLVIG